MSTIDQIRGGLPLSFMRRAALRGVLDGKGHAVRAGGA